MKIYIYLTIAVLLIAGIALSSLFWLNISSNRISEAILPLEKSINEEDWDKAGFNFSDLKRVWEKNSRLWHIIINHQEIINIELALKRLAYGISQKEKLRTGENIAEIQYWLEYIRKNEEIDLKNIF